MIICVAFVENLKKNQIEVKFLSKNFVIKNFFSIYFWLKKCLTSAIHISSSIDTILCNFFNIETIQILLLMQNMQNANQSSIIKVSMFLTLFYTIF